jgi:adenylate cyclase class 2
MSNEVETKILDVDAQKISEKLEDLGAEKILDTKYSVDWFRTKNSKEGDDDWYLRIRTTSHGKSELTWKGQSMVLGAARTHKEINIILDDPEKAANLLMEIGLEKYAHQDKHRISWILKDWRFDLDSYPNMPPYLEIEGKDEVHIQKAIAFLNLQNNKKNAGGERLLIQEEYGLDWYNMSFTQPT